MHLTRRRLGFTIVELIIVIVVIAVIAAITILAYNGIQERAKNSALNSSLSQVKKKIALYQVDTGSFPTSLDQAGIASGNGITYQYQSSASTYCVTASTGGVSYTVTENTSPESGACSGHASGGVLTNLHRNPGATANTGYTSYTGPAPNASTMTTVSASWSASGSAVRTIWSAGGSSSGDVGVFTNAWNGLTAGTTYTLRYRVNAGQNSTLGIPGIYASSGTYSISARSTSSPTALTANTPVTRWVTFQGDATALGAGLRIVQTPQIVAGYYYEISEAVLYEGSYNSAVGFYWGSSPGWTWNGTQNNATSTGPI